MRRSSYSFYVVGCALFAFALAGCGGNSDTAHESDSVDAANPYAAFAGDWMTEVYSKDGGEPLVVVLIKATDSKENWSMKFTHLDDAVPANNVFMKGDSAVFEVGPYPSALREGQTVQNVTSYLHAHGSAMSGRFKATYGDGEVLAGTMKAEKVQ